MVLSPVSSGFLASMCCSGLRWTSRGTLCRSLEFSFSAALSSLVLCTANSSCLGFPRLPGPSPQLRETASLPLQSPSPVLRPGNSLQAVSWRTHRAHPICFPHLRDYRPLLPNVWKPLFHIFCLVFVAAVSGMRRNLVPVTLSWLEVEFFSRI